MHHQHILIVNAASGEEAVDEVLSRIERWGDENNWRFPIGALSQAGEAYLAPEQDRPRRFPAEREDACLDLIRGIPLLFDTLNGPPLPNEQEDALDLMRLFVGVPTVKPGAAMMLEERPVAVHGVITGFLWQWREFMRNRGCTVWTSPGLGDRLAWGLTVLDGTAGAPEQRWAVLIDMHS